LTWEGFDVEGVRHWGRACVVCPRGIDVPVSNLRIQETH